MNDFEIPDDLRYFATEILPKSVELEKRLSQIHMRLKATDFTERNSMLWENIRTHIIDRYPQYSEFLFGELACRVVFRPKNRKESLPGFQDTRDDTDTLLLWYGMDYRPEKGDHVGITCDRPWTFYMLPDLRYYRPEDYITLLYLYDNAGKQLVNEQTPTVGPITKDNFLVDYLRMKITIYWLDVDENTQLDPLVHDMSLESLSDFVHRLGIKLDE